MQYERTQLLLSFSNTGKNIVKMILHTDTKKQSNKDSVFPI